MVTSTADATTDATAAGTAVKHSVNHQGRNGEKGSANNNSHGTGYTRTPDVSAPSHNSDGRFTGAKEGRSVAAQSTSQSSRQGTASYRESQDDLYDIPDDIVGSNELADPSNADEGPISVHQPLEQGRSHEQDNPRSKELQRTASKDHPRMTKEEREKETQKASKAATKLYVISYLVLFSFLGTLARLGLQAITFYPGAPVVFSELWANVGGSIFMGFLSEDRMLFRDEWGRPKYHEQIQKAKKQKLEQDEDSGSGSDNAVDLDAAKKAHAATKKTIPLYIGLATGFCGCFTSFSSFIRDVFLALANDLPTPLNHPTDYQPISAMTESTISRNGGYSVMALLAVTIITVALCISGLHVGAHLAIASERFTPSLPYRFCRNFLDPLAVFLAWGCWLGAILLAIFPPDRHSGSPEIWRGRAVFAMVFAPLGCLGRFYASLYLNGKMASFPWGTFFVNILGTAILGICYDLQHVPLGGVVGCQVLEGIEDGFCGCVTTVSTWVSELSSLRRNHAYRYGAASVVVALCCLIVIIGSMKWTRGLSEIQCVK
ncbi:CrcB-like protein [Diplocarpon rosae]|nr:CrcB-like protein [Diplocarpon rosae]